MLGMPLSYSPTKLVWCAEWHNKSNGEKSVRVELGGLASLREFEELFQTCRLLFGCVCVKELQIITMRKIRQRRMRNTLNKEMCIGRCLFRVIYISIKSKAGKINMQTCLHTHIFVCICMFMFWERISQRAREKKRAMLRTVAQKTNVAENN